MNTAEAVFSIRDLENLSGIKAHTIRILKKRCNLLTPKRSDAKILCNDPENLKKQLIVSFLNNNGLRI